jgi:predicted  nucleic acid-binding Zn-ribbon protein
MMSRPLNLYRLQQIDSKIDQANARLKEIAALLSNNATLRKARALAARAENNLEAAQKEQRQAEVKVKDQRIKIEQTEATLYGGTVRNPKELQDLQNEVAAHKRFLDTLEERQLEAMLATDEAVEKNQEAQKILGQYRAQAEKQQASLVQERTQLESQKAAAEKQRQGAAGIVSPDDLTIYDRLRKQRACVAVSGVKDRACNACGSTLTAALHQAARSPSQLVFCDMCGRILYAS